jgi:hypothetical protein
MDRPETTLPSIEALRSSDERLLSYELCSIATRRQIALVRSIADALEHCMSERQRPGKVIAMRAQLAEEVARLGCRALEAAAAGCHADESGVYRVSMSDSDVRSC